MTERSKSSEKATPEWSESTFRSLIENASEVVTILDADGTICYESPAVERVLGWRPEELEGRDLFGFVHPDDVAEVAARFRNALENPGQKIPYTLRFRHKDGSYRWLEGIGVNLLDDPAVRGIVANSRDVTDRVESEQQLATYSKELEQERALFAQLFESSPAAVVLADPHDRVLRINPEFTRLFGYTGVEAVGRTVGELITPEQLQNEALALTGQAVEGERVEVESVRRRKDGSMLHVSVVGVPVRLHGSEIAVYGMYRDISEHKEAEAALEREAITDPLTGLLNRRGFLAQLSRRCEQAKRTGGAPLLLYADLDGLKRINDAHGHAEGDRVLQDVAEVLKPCFRSSDSIARFGGDEFAILVADVEDTSEHTMRERIRLALQHLNERSNRPYRVSLSLGVIRASAEAASAEDLLMEADRRMYTQKRHREGRRSPDST